MIYIKMISNMVFTIVFLAWFFKQICTKRENLIKNKATEVMFLHLQKSLDLKSILDYFPERNDDVLIALDEIMSHPYS